MREEHYKTDELYEGTMPGSDEPTVLRPPPVEELLCVYGKNLPTEVGYIYRPFKKTKFNTFGEPLTLKLDRSRSKAKRVLEGKKGFLAKHGIIFEVPDRDEDIQSGDGTVPYASLAYHKKWENTLGAPTITSVEIEGADHREMLSMPLVIGSLVRHISMIAN